LAQAMLARAFSAQFGLNQLFTILPAAEGVHFTC